jgi:hypothetical protein
MSNAGRTDRRGRIEQRKSGVGGTTSQDILMVVSRLYRLSKDESSSRHDKNHSRFVYAGIPLLLAAVWSFAIEYEGSMNVGPVRTNLATDPLVKVLKTQYNVSGSLLEDLQDLVEIRNEILHPVPLPTGTPDNWPNYLRRVKLKGLLSSTGVPNADYIMLSQIASHRLFVWAAKVTKGLYAAIINSNPLKAPAFQLFLDNFDIFFG